VIESTFIHNVDVERQSVDSEDIYGENVYSWDTHIENMPCRLYDSLSSGRSVEVEDDQKQVVTSTHILVCRESDITNKDRITGLNLLSGKIFDIEHVTTRHDEIGAAFSQLYLREVV